MRKAVVVLAIAIVGTVLVAGCGTPQPTGVPTIVALATTSIPQVPAATKPVDTATTAPTDTPLPPTSTATLLPTDTSTPTNSPLPPVPTATLLPTDTPPPSNTPTPLPPTDTPAPPTATVARPTKTPAPPTAMVPPPPRFPWRGQVVGTFSNCALTRLMGLALDRNGGVAGDIWVHFWADGWEGAWTRSTWTVDEGYPGLDDSSNWDGVLDIYSKAGTWYVCVVPAEGSRDCVSPTVTAQTVAEPCAPDSGGVQIVRIVFQQN
jgi:hypothetical protein